MAVWSIVNLSELRGERRLDAEFWQPEYISNEKNLLAKPHTSLGELATSIRKGIFFILASEYVEDGVPFYRSSNVGPIHPREHNLAFISAERDRAEPKTHLCRGDIMLAKTGKHGASVVLCSCCNVSQDVVALKVDRKKVNPFFMAAYLNTTSGALQLQRWFQGQVQEHLSLIDARNILIPLPEDAIQDKTQQLIEDAENTGQRAAEAYREAGTILTAALGLDHVDLAPRLFYEDTFNHATAAGRFDAEYFSPRMQNVIETLSADGQSIGDVASLTKQRFMPVPGKPFEYIKIADIGTDGIAVSNSVRGEDAPSRATWIVKMGDIITSTVRPIRRLSAIIVPDQDGFVCSSGFAVLRACDIEPELLLTYLRLPLVAELLDLRTTASMYPAISTTDLLKIPFRKPDAQSCARIVAKVRESIDARAESFRLLDEAKRTVEAAIQEGA